MTIGDGRLLPRTSARARAELGEHLVHRDQLGGSGIELGQPATDLRVPGRFELGGIVRSLVIEARAAVNGFAQCRNSRRPVKTMAMPCSSAAAITSGSRT